MTTAQFYETYHVQLNAQQKAALEAVDGAVLLLAVPGSGKTTVLVNRLGYMLAVRGIAPEQILTMTFTTAAATEMRERFAALFGEKWAMRMEFCTINALANRIVRHYVRTYGKTPFTLVEERRQSAMLGELYRQTNGEFATESVLKAIKTNITFVKNRMLDELEIRELKLEGMDFPAIYRAYQQEMRQSRLMDFDDQLVYAHRILRRYPDILRTYQIRYHYLCVDEAQDTSKIQHSIISLLAQETQNLFMVGDEDQSIYGFRAAYPQALMDFTQTYPQATVLLMEQNYRSTREIVAAADGFIQRNQNRHPKHMTAARGTGRPVREVSLYDRPEQYAYLEKLAADCPVETAVLYRDNDSALPLIDRLERKGLPYRCRRMDTSFFSHRSVRDITDFIRFAQNPRDGELFLQLYYKLSAGISKDAATTAVRRSALMETPVFEELDQLPNLSGWTKRQCAALQTHFTNLLGESAGKAVYRMVHFMGYGEYLDQRGADRNKVEILEALGAQEPSPVGLLARLEQLEQIVKDGGSAESKLVLSTIHSAKGLEYDRVVLMDVMDGLFPKLPPEEAQSPEDLENLQEERRLFYVGMTRAKEELTLFRFRKVGLATAFVDEILPRKAPPQRPGAPIRPAPKPAHRQTMSPAQLEERMAGFVPGVRVAHRVFGTGWVAERKEAVVSVEFADGTLRRLSLQAAIPTGLLRLLED